MLLKFKTYFFGNFIVRYSKLRKTSEERERQEVIELSLALITSLGVKKHRVLKGKVFDF